MGGFYDSRDCDLERVSWQYLVHLLGMIKAYVYYLLFIDSCWRVDTQYCSAIYRKLPISTESTHKGRMSYLKTPEVRMSVRQQFSSPGSNSHSCDCHRKKTHVLPRYIRPAAVDKCGSALPWIFLPQSHRRHSHRSWVKLIRPNIITTKQIRCCLIADQKIILLTRYL